MSEHAAYAVEGTPLEDWLRDAGYDPAEVHQVVPTDTAGEYVIEEWYVAVDPDTGARTRHVATSPRAVEGLTRRVTISAPFPDHPDVRARWE